MATRVAKKKETNISKFDVSMLEADAGVGVADMGQDDLALPFLKILSGLDPLLDELDEAKRGDLYNTVSGQIYKGKDGVSVVPCAYQRRFIQWAPRGSGTGAPIAIFDTEVDCPKVERSKDDNKDYVVGGDGSYIEETHQHFVLIVGKDGSAETALIAMKSTALKKSRKWNSMIASATVHGKNGPFTPPRYGFVYRAKTVMEENSKGSWHNWELSRDKQIDDANLFRRAKEFAASITSGDVVVKHQNEESGNETDNSVPF
tara:strand:- start:6889 stop:7668 length:780 start_codon:yes stop_codon:yes gene_type:complete